MMNLDIQYSVYVRIPWFLVRKELWNQFIPTTFHSCKACNTVCNFLFSDCLQTLWAHYRAMWQLFGTISCLAWLSVQPLFLVSFYHSGKPWILHLSGQCVLFPMQIMLVLLLWNREFLIFVSQSELLHCKSTLQCITHGIGLRILITAVCPRPYTYVRY